MALTKKPKKTESQGSSSNPLLQAKSALSQALKTDEWQTKLDVSQLSQSLPHLPTGSMVIDYLIGGKPNKQGVPPCPGLPKGRIINLYGHESSGKCLPADTFVSTSEGIKTIQEIFESRGHTCTTANWTREEKIDLVNLRGEYETTTHFTSNGSRPVRQFRTFSGSEIRSTLNHPHLVMSPRGAWVWKHTKNLEVGDVLVSPRTLPAGNVSVPSDTAYALGLLVADGHLGKNRVSVTNDDPSIVDFLQNHMSAALELPIPKEYAANKSTDFHYNSKDKVASLYDMAGWNEGKAANKRVGEFVRSFDRDSLKSFLQGYFDCECYIDPEKNEMEAVSASPMLLKELQLLLRVFGISSLVRDKKVKEYPDTEYHRLIVSGADLRLYRDQIGTRSVKRAGELECLRVPSQVQTNYDSVPFCSGLLQDLYQSIETDREMHHLFADYMGDNPRARLTYDRLDKIIQACSTGQSLDLGGHTLSRLVDIRAANYLYDEIVDIQDCDPVPTFDFAMPSTHSFVANGFVTHNTTLALTAAATTIKNGGTVCYIDWENEIVPEYAASLGVPVHDDTKFLLSQPETLEDGMAVAFTMASAGVSFIVFDSVGAGVTRAYFDKSIKETGDRAQVGANALLWSQFLPKLRSRTQKTGSTIIGISQMRDAINTMGYGDTSTVQGGKAWKFYSALRMKLQRIKTEKSSDYSSLSNSTEERVIGAVIKAKLDKCKVSPQQGNEETFYIRWGEGIDDLRSMMEIGIAHNLIKKSASWLEWNKPDGDSIRLQGVEKLRALMMANPELISVLEAQVKPYMAGEGVLATSTSKEVFDDGDGDEDGDDNSLDAEVQALLNG